MRGRILQLMGVAVIAEATASVLFLPSCGVTSSGDCADKATCAEAGVGASTNPPDVSIERSDPQPAEGSDVAIDNTSEARLDVVSEKPVVDVAIPSEDAGRDAGTVDASADASDSMLEDVHVDVGVDASIDVFEDVPADAIYMGDTSACGPCTNACTPSFVQCCTADGGCGCIEYFFPVLCL